MDNNNYEEMQINNELESLKASYSQYFELTPNALELADEWLKKLEPKWQIHALKACLGHGLELAEFEGELHYWRKGFRTPDEELAHFKAEYGKLFGERSLVTAEMLIEGMEKDTQAHAFRYSTLHNVKFEDIKNELTQWNWTFNLTTTAFSAIMERQERFEDGLRVAAHEAGIELTQRLRPLLGAVAQMEKTVQGLGLAVKDIEHSSKSMSDSAYKEFKAKTNPEELKRLVVEGAGAKLSDKLLEAVNAAVAKEMKLRRYIANICMLAFFCGGMAVGRFF